MNQKMTKLLSILSSCLPEDAELARESRIARIVQSKAYRDLQARDSYRKIFNEYLSQQKLEGYSPEELQKLEEALPSLADFLQNLIYSLTNGICPTLKDSDRPDFFDRDALEDMADRLDEGNGKNYTNIDPADCMMVFDAGTVKSIKDRFTELPANCQDYGEALATLFGNQKYCIPESEIKSMEAAYDEAVAEMLDEAQAGKHRAFRHKMLRLLICLIFMLIPWFIGRLTGGMSMGMSIFATIGMLIVGIVVWWEG